MVEAMTKAVSFMTVQSCLTSTSKGTQYQGASSFIGRPRPPQPCPILNHLMGKKANAHQLTAANDGKLPVSMYVELDLNFLGIVVPKVGVLITQEPNELLETHHKTKLPGMVGWNLIKLAYEVFVKNYGILCLDNFDCPTGVSPLLFSQLCVYHHCKALPQISMDSSSCLKKSPKFYHQ